MLAINQFHQGQTLDLAGQLDDQSVNCIMTSPPYFNLRDFGVGAVDWPDRNVESILDAARGERKRVAGQLKLF